MATKSQLKQYFETGKIPTQAQFGELIDFVQPLISDNVSNRPNQTLLFGGDTPNPIINGLRIVHYYQNNDNIHNYWIFTNEAGRNNRFGISIPMFVIKRISSEEPNISLDMLNLEYAIPTREQLTNWVQQGYDCDTATDSEIHHAMQAWSFKLWGGGTDLTPDTVSILFRNTSDNSITSFICELGYISLNSITTKVPIRFTKTYTPAKGEGATVEIYNLSNQSSLNGYVNAWKLIEQQSGFSIGRITTSESRIYEAVILMLNYCTKS